MYEDFKLLIGGKEAFSEIVSRIDSARESVLINMFIWRDDVIGNQIAEAIFRAAERGVRVDIAVDRYGAIFEKAEETGRSFFHKVLTSKEKLKIAFLRRFYPTNYIMPLANDDFSPLYRSIINHPNITVRKDIVTSDHSKYFVIDDEILIFGSINVEEKAAGVDAAGRVYRDYVVEIIGNRHTRAFHTKMACGEGVSTDYVFGINSRKMKLYEVKDLYMDMIRSASDELVILMPYFSPIKEFVKAIRDAMDGGVKVSIILPASTNYYDSLNRRCLKKLLSYENAKLTVYLTPMMLHSKLIANERYLSVGSANITKKSLCQMDELNIFMERHKCPFMDSIDAELKHLKIISTKVLSPKEMTYNPPKAMVEGLFD